MRNLHEKNYSNTFTVHPEAYLLACQLHQANPLLPISFYSSPFLLTNLFFSGVAQITSITPDTLSSAENKLFIPFDTPEAEVITMICMRASLPIELVCEYVCV